MTPCPVPRQHHAWFVDHTYCGSALPADVATFQGGLRLQFTSDAETQAAGFSLQYSLACETAALVSGSLGVSE